MTLTLVRHSYPRELMRTLKTIGFIIDEPYEGIYRVEGKISIPVQIVVSSRLTDGEYDGLQLLAEGCTKEAVLHYAEKAVASEDENIKINAGTVISICLDINEELGSQLKEEGTMNETIRRIFKKDFDLERQNGINEGINEGINKGINKGINEANKRVATDMLKKNLPLSLIEEISKLSEDTIRNLAKNIGVAVL